MKRNKFWVIVLISLLFVSGCVDDENSEPFYVVEAFIFTGQPVQDIVIKELTPIDSGSSATAPIIDDAQIGLIKNDTDQYSLEFNSDKQSYFYPGDDLEINPGDVFRIEVFANGRESFGETVIPIEPENVGLSADSLAIPRLRVSPGLRNQIIALFADARLFLTWQNALDDFHYVVVSSDPTNDDPLLPELVPDEAKDLLGSFRFITEPTRNTTFDIVGIALETYGNHSATVYRVNSEYAALFENSTQDSRDLNAPPTNMIGAFGIFSGFSGTTVDFRIVEP